MPVAALTATARVVAETAAAVIADMAANERRRAALISAGEGAVVDW